MADDCITVTLTCCAELKNVSCSTSYDATAYLFQRALEHSGIPPQLFRVTDGEEVIAFLLLRGSYAGAPRPDLVVLDLKLPKNSGYEVLKEIKSNPQLADISVVVFSSSVLDEDRRRAMDLGAELQPSSRTKGLGLRNHFLTRALLGSLTLRPDDSLTVPRTALSIGFIRFVSSTNAIQATGLLTLVPMGLPPTEHASLRWSHWSAKILCGHFFEPVLPIAIGALALREPSSSRSLEAPTALRIRR